MQCFFERTTRYIFNDHSQQNIVGIGIGKCRIFRKIGRLNKGSNGVFRIPNDQRRRKPALCNRIVARNKIVDTAAVVEQAADFYSAVDVWKHWQILSNGVIERQFALIYQLQDHRGCEHFGHAGLRKQATRIHWSLVVNVGTSGSALPDPVAGKQNGC